MLILFFSTHARRWGSTHIYICTWAGKRLGPYLHSSHRHNLSQTTVDFFHFVHLLGCRVGHAQNNGKHLGLAEISMEIRRPEMRVQLMTVRSASFRTKQPGTMLVFYFFLSPSVDVSLKPDLSHSYIIPVITFYLTPANHKADTSFSRGSLEQGVEKLS